MVDSDGLLDKDSVRVLRSGGFERIIITGSQDSISEEVKTQIGDSVEYVRLGGANRYESSAIIAQFCLDEGMSLEGVAVAYGGNFPDALAGAVLCGRNNSVLILADDDNVGYAKDLFAENKESIHYGYVLGDTPSISEYVFNTLSQALY